MRPRQHLRVRSSLTTVAARAVVVLLALALFWYGLMVLLLALGVSPHTVNDMSAYRTAYNFLAGLTAGDITGTVRIVIAVVGVVAFLVLGSLAVPPRVYRTRRDLDLGDEGPGESVVEPRAIERMAEIAAREDARITHARARYSAEELSVDVSIDDPAQVADTLDGARRRVAQALGEHELPHQPVHVALTGLEQQEKELA